MPVPHSLPRLNAGFFGGFDFTLPKLPPFDEWRRPAFLKGWRLFAATVPAGLLLGLLTAQAMDPEMLHQGGKPYGQFLGGNVDVAWEEPLSYPIDPAPFGYASTETIAYDPDYIGAGIAEAGDYSLAEREQANANYDYFPDDASGPAAPPVAVVPVVVPQDTPAAETAAPAAP